MNTENYVLFDRKDRSKDGFYTIPGGVTHVFQFQIFNARNSNISAIQPISDVSQQGSLQLWLSRRPLDIPLFPHIVSINPLILENKPKVITLYSETMSDLENGCLVLDPLLTYYANIRNMQSSPNSYRVIFPR